MPFFACTLLADGSSDRVLKPILEWLLDQHSPLPYQLQFAQELQGQPKGLSARISAALDQYPCDLLFVHRDAESVMPEGRLREIEQAWETAAVLARWVAIIPVRMTEAWLLFDESAIRAAAGNPNGVAPLDLPAVSSLESIADPKDLLVDALRTASGLASGRLKRFPAAARLHRIPELMSTFEPLRALPSFRRLEAQLQSAVSS